MNQDPNPTEPTLPAGDLPRSVEIPSTQADADRTETWAGQAPREIGSPDEVRQLPNISGYEVLSFIAQGGMGVVVKARDEKLGRLVAIKMPRVDRLPNKKARERFLREARAAAKFRQPNICSIHEVGESDGLPYIVMDYIDGPTLDRWVKDSSPPARDVALAVSQLASAVQFAHDRGVLHRDIKPSNAMIDSASGEAVLMDFGLAKDLEPDADQLTHDGQIMGTPAFMPREQAAGKLVEMGPHSDVYSLGAVLYSLLGSRPPFSGQVGEVLTQVLTQRPTPIRRLMPDIHRDLEVICEKAMAAEATDRYPTARELADDLQRFHDGQPILARPESLPRRAWRFAARNRTVASLLVVVLLALLAAGAAGRWAVESHRRSRAIEKFERALEETQWSEGEITELTALVNGISQHDEAFATQAEQRITQQFGDHVAAMTERSQLAPPEVRVIETAITKLEDRDPRRASELRTRLTERLRSWLTLFEVSAPFSDYRIVFSPDDAVRKDGRLRRKLKSDSPRVGLIKTKVPCPSSAELEVVFQQAAEINETSVGLALNAVDDEGYEFALWAPRFRQPLDAESGERGEKSEPGINRPTIGQAVQRGDALQMQIRRSGVVVRSQEIVVEKGPLRLVASRKAGTLQFQVGGQRPMEFVDPFSLPVGNSGVFAVLWPRGTALVSLRGSYRALPERPSPLEQADEFYSRRQYATALAEYRRQQEQGADQIVLQEARTKEGLALLRLGRRSDAIEALESVVGQEESKWTIVATCYLWSVFVEAKRFEDADAIYETIERNYRHEDLVALLPRDVRLSIARSYSEITSGANLLEVTPKHVDIVKRGLAIEQLLNGRVSLVSKFRVVRVYRAVGDTNAAAHYSSELIHDDELPLLPAFNRLWLIEEYCWLKRLQGDPSTAIRLLAKFLGEEDETLAAQYTPLLIEWARCHVARGEFDLAAEAISSYQTASAPAERIYRHHSAAALVEGFLLEQAGQRDAAIDAWRGGLYKMWQPLRVTSDLEPKDRPTPLPPPNPDNFSGMEMLQFMVLASLAGELSNEEAQAVVRWHAFRQPKGSPLSMLDGPLALVGADFFANSVRAAFQSTRGKEIAHDVAFQAMPFREMYISAVKMPAVEALRLGAFGDSEREEVYEFLLNLADDGYSRYQADQLSTRQIVQLGLTWRGRNDILGWAGVARSLDGSLRVRLGYLFGWRYLKLERPDDAREFFQVVAEDPASDAELKKLANEKLVELETPFTE